MLTSSIKKKKVQFKKSETSQEVFQRLRSEGGKPRLNCNKQNVGSRHYCIKENKYLYSLNI